jgi:hypothetical protein
LRRAAASDCSSDNGRVGGSMRGGKVFMTLRLG